MNPKTGNPTLTGESGSLRGRRITREKALTAAARILLEEGYARLTMERVAAESRIAKTTLYRRWPTKAALCMELYLEATRDLRDPRTGNVKSDLRAIADTVVRLQTRTVAGPALLGLIAEAQITPESKGPLLAEFSQQRRRLTRLVLQRAIDRGELQPGTDVDLVIDAIGGAITFRLLQGHAPINKRFTNQLIDLVLSGCLSNRALPRKNGK
ncbi:TetR/AcrR family transcriptional regulator [Acidobacteria bacterium AB60]|nr:TetR/AcrR family transcriptional regulator [Acidobacteria bacterium AB60]